MYNGIVEEDLMARKAIRDLRDEEAPVEVPAGRIEGRETSRKLQLADVLEHQGKIEIDLDQETLARLRSGR